MRVLDFFVMAIAAAAVFGYVCRLDQLHVARHKLRVILLHVALLACAAFAGIAAYERQLGLRDIAGLAASVIWLWISIPSWRRGPPSHFTKAEPLDAKHWTIGGKR